MAYPVSNLKYPNTLDFENMVGGYNWIARCNNANDKDSYIKIGSCVSIDLSDMDISAAEKDTVKSLLTFSNGVKLVVTFRTKSTNNEVLPMAVWARFGLKRTSGTIDPLGNWMSFWGSGGGYGFFCSPANVAKTYGAKFFVNNNFERYNDVVTVDGVTELYRLDLVIMMPGRDTEYPGSLRSNDHIHSNMTYIQHFERDIPYDSARDWWYPNREVPVLNEAYGIIDLDDFASLVSGQSGTPVNRNDIFKERTPGDEPSQDDDPSQPGGGGGNYDDTSDPIPFPDNPTGGALSSGAIKAFVVTPAIMQAVFNKLWDTSIFDIPLQFQKLVDNPLDCLISFHCLPVTPTTSGQSSIKLGNLDTETQAPNVSSQYLTIDCGSLSIKEFWGSALDYSPYTKCELYMPFVGIKELKIEDVMKSTVHIKYNVDVFTGDCLCNVMCGKSVLYKFAGNLKQDIPVSGRTNNMGIKGMIGAMTAFAGGMMGGAMGGPVGAAVGAGAVLSSAASVATSKIVTTRSGSLSGSVGLLDDFRPFFIFHRPVQSLANKFNTYKGYPSNITAQLSSLTGYTEVEYINLQNIPNATSAEMDEIKNLLKQGVLL